MDLLDGFLRSNFQVCFDLVSVCGSPYTNYDAYQIDCWYSDANDHQSRNTKWSPEDEVLCQSLLEIQV